MRGLYLARHQVTLWIWLVVEEEQQGRQMLMCSTKIGQGSNKTWQPARTLLFLNAHAIYIFWLVGGQRRSKHSFWKDHTFVLPILFTYAVWFIGAVGQVANLIIFCQFFGWPSHSLLCGKCNNEGAGANRRMSKGKGSQGFLKESLMWAVHSLSHIRYDLFTISIHHQGPPAILSQF